MWFAVHDWHVKHLQQPALGRDASGRYTISVMGTQLVDAAQSGADLHQRAVRQSLILGRGRFVTL